MEGAKKGEAKGLGIEGVAVGAAVAAVAAGVGATIAVAAGQTESEEEPPADLSKTEAPATDGESAQPSAELQEKVEDEPTSPTVQVSLLAVQTLTPSFTNVGRRSTARASCG